MNKITVGSLFSGIGGLELGLERTGGFRTVWQCEIDEYATKVLEKHWPDVTRFRDVRTVGKHNLSAVDVLAGGFPCQNISLANQLGVIGINAPQSGLWREFFRIICELQPGYVIVENVAALLSRGIDRVLGDMASIGYDAEWDVLRASDFGAPHKRDRVFIVAYPHEERWSSRLRPSANFLPGVHLPRQTSNPVDDVWHRLSQLEERLGEPSVFGSYDGISRELERQLGAYGNAVVPQVAEYIGRCILASVESGAVA